MTTTAKDIISALTFHQPVRITRMTGAELRRVLNDLSQYQKANKE
ncbi:5'-nucleotidase C-terminal domain-containing protein [Vibrio parahaemolyticus]